jgi:hypothetical protein
MNAWQRPKVLGLCLWKVVAIALCQSAIVIGRHFDNNFELVGVVGYDGLRTRITTRMNRDECPGDHKGAASAEGEQTRLPLQPHDSIIGRAP